MAKGRKRLTKNANLHQKNDMLKNEITHFYSDISNKLKGRSRLKIANEIRGMHHELSYFSKRLSRNMPIVYYFFKSLLVTIHILKAKVTENIKSVYKLFKEA